MSREDAHTQSTHIRTTQPLVQTEQHTIHSPHPFQTHSLPQLTRAAKVHKSDCTSFGVTEQNIFGLQITVDDPQLGCGEVQESCAKLLCKLASEVEGDSVKVGVPQELVEIVGEELKHQAEVATEHEVPLETYCKCVCVCVVCVCVRERERERERERKR